MRVKCRLVRIFPNPKSPKNPNSNMGEKLISSPDAIRLPTPTTNVIHVSEPNPNPKVARLGSNPKKSTKEIKHGEISISIVIVVVLLLAVVICLSNFTKPKPEVSLESLESQPHESRHQKKIPSQSFSFPAKAFDDPLAIQLNV